MGKRQYIIRYGGLPAGLHEYEFKLGGTFFQGFENSEIAEADLEVKAVLTKQNNLLQLDLEIEGTVALDCDRCMKNFDYPVEAREHLVIKHGDPAESNDEILVIPEGEEEFDLSHYLYEYVVLAIPARRVPCEIDPQEYLCDTEMLEKLEALRANPETEETPQNPLWDELNKLKN
ncbi:MAG TPA: DUF177 domain-containing protein [Bacteroidia bacterium]|nr:DUF177 domain-containing protein [Bacteroidia bacterium]